MSEIDESEEYFQSLLQKRISGDSLQQDEEEEQTQISEDDMENEFQELSESIEQGREECERKRKELEQLKGKKSSRSPKLSKSIARLEKQNDMLKKELQKREDLVEKVTSLFYSIYSKGADFSQYPEIDVDGLKDVCGVPPDADNTHQKKRMDPIALRIAEKDSYFSDVNDNDEFVERVNQLMDDLDRSRSETSTLSENFASFSSIRSTSSSSSSRSTKTSPLRNSIVKESQRNVVDQAKFAVELTHLLEEKQKLINQIVEEKRKIKERELRYKKEMNSPTKTVIKLRMYNPGSSKDFTSSLTRTELSPTTSPTK